MPSELCLIDTCCVFILSKNANSSADSFSCSLYTSKTKLILLSSANTVYLNDKLQLFFCMDLTLKLNSDAKYERITTFFYFCSLF